MALTPGTRLGARGSSCRYTGTDRLKVTMPLLMALTSVFPFRRSACALVLAIGLTALSTPAFAQSDEPTVFVPDPVRASSRGSLEATSFSGPPAPVPPAVMSERDENGQVTVRAIRVTRPLVIDGRLDDGVYKTAPAISGFIQQEPDEGTPATEKTEVWIFFDGTNVYIAARLWSTHPERLQANEMRRDNTNIFRNDFFGATLDTLYDRRSGSYFMTNALGGQRDALITDESRSVNFDYNMVWRVRSARFDQGWTTEMAIPFKSLRYRQGREQVWGIILARQDWWKNETSYLETMPRSAGLSGGFRLSLASTLVGIETPGPGLNLDIKPYATSGATKNAVKSGYNTALNKDWGLDVKYGLTKSLAVDFTYNTDFAQVEVDNQQVNLTRFNLFFPEKRDFFLEGQGLFTFGGASAGFGGGGGQQGAAQTPVIFFSRQIGLHDGVSVPIKAGGRLMGKAGPYNVGLLTIRTDAVPTATLPETSFSVVRLKRDILRRSAIGIIGTARTPNTAWKDSNAVYGVDISLNFFENLETTGYYARSRTVGKTGDAESFRGRVYYNGDKYGLDVDYLKVGTDFNPEIGFLSRRGFAREFLQARYSPRPNVKGLRRLWFDVSVDNIHDPAVLDPRNARIQTRKESGFFRYDFKTGDSITLGYDRIEDHPEQAFRLAGGLTVQPGAYLYNQAILSYIAATSRKITGTFSWTTGGFYLGTQKALSYNGRVGITGQLAVEPSISVNWIDFSGGAKPASAEEIAALARSAATETEAAAVVRLALNPGQKTRTEIYSARTTYAVNPRIFVVALLQYNSAAKVVGLNTRFRWEYQSGSDFYVVYSEGRDTIQAGFPVLSNRQLVVKFTRLLRY